MPFPCSSVITNVEKLSVNQTLEVYHIGLTKTMRQAEQSLRFTKLRIEFTRFIGEDIGLNCDDSRHSFKVNSEINLSKILSQSYY